MRKVKSKVISAIKSLNYSFFSVFHQRVKGKVRQDIYKNNTISNTKQLYHYKT